VKNDILTNYFLTEPAFLFLYYKKIINNFFKENQKN